MQIDLEKLAEADRAMVDTNVLIFALGGGTKNPSHKAARALVEAFAAKKGMRLLVAAPSFAEFEIRANQPRIPAGGGLIEVVAFDKDAASILAERMPMGALKKLGYAPKGAENGRHCLKFDSMIVACALRHKASCIISTDEEHIPKVAAQAGVRCLTPEHFRQAQGSLELVPPTLHEPEAT